MSDKLNNASEILLYQAEDGQTKIQVRLEDETAWLSQMAMSELFQTSVPNVSMHLRNIFREGELHPDSVVKDYLTTAADGKNYMTRYYNLDVIISVGYRVRSHRGTQFRQWATESYQPINLSTYQLINRLHSGKNFSAFPTTPIKGMMIFRSGSLTALPIT